MGRVPPHLLKVHQPSHHISSFSSITGSAGPMFVECVSAQLAGVKKKHKSQKKLKQKQKMLGLGQKILSPQILPPPFFGPCQGRILVGLTQKKIGYFAHFFFQNLTKIYIFFRHFGPFQVCSCDQGRICCIIFSLFFFDVFWVFFFHFGCFFFHLDHHLFQPWSPRSKRWCHFFNQHGPTSSLKSPNPLKKNPSKKGKASNRGGGKEVQQNVSWNLFETPPPIWLMVGLFQTPIGQLGAREPMVGCSFSK